MKCKKSSERRLLKRYRPEIDGIRRLAVVAVIINHFYSDILPSGFLGVDVFFVISGFVITSALVDHRSETFRNFIIEFYERRIKRLLPALLFYVIVVSVLISLVNPEPATSLLTGMASIFGLSNLYLISRSADYFSDSSQLNVFTHTWSLGVEEQFYLIFPLLVWFAGFGRSAASTKVGKKRLFLVISSLSAISLIALVLGHSRQGNLAEAVAYFSPLTRF